jgi:hypothetical protein
LRERLLVTLGQCKWQGRVIAQWGFPMGGMRRVFWIFLALIDEGQRQEVSVHASKLKGYREITNLKCSINFDAGELVLAW